MRILIADDNAFTRRMLTSLLKKWGYEVIPVPDGNQAWEIMQQEDTPRLIILDWIMPGLEGPELCRRFRTLAHAELSYLIILTSLDRKSKIVEGLDAGANDYVTKPFDHGELRARISVGCKMIQLQQALSERIRDLTDAIQHIKTLQGILPICSYCKKIRDDKNYWQQLESYFRIYADVQFSHGVCPECLERHVKPELDRLKREKDLMGG